MEGLKSMAPRLWHRAPALAPEESKTAWDFIPRVLRFYLRAERGAGASVEGARSGRVLLWHSQSMSLLPHRLLLVPTFLGLLTGGCVAHRHHSKEIVQTLRATTPDNAQRNFFVVEFDDNGYEWDVPYSLPARHAGAREGSELRRALRRIASARGQGKAVVLLIYVHGWKHFAAEESQDFVRFREIVTMLNDAKTREHVDLPGEVVGVYVGWRGTPLRAVGPGGAEDALAAAAHPGSWLDWATWLPQQLSFWNRKATAERVAGATLTHAVFSLAAAAKAPGKIPEAARAVGIMDEAAEKTKVPQSKVLVIGHSMGGLMVERAVAQSIVGAKFAMLPDQSAWDKITATLDGTVKSTNEASRETKAKLEQLTDAATRAKQKLPALKREQATQDRALDTASDSAQEIKARVLRSEEELRKQLENWSEKVVGLSRGAKAAATDKWLAEATSSWRKVAPLDRAAALLLSGDLRALEKTIDGRGANERPAQAVRDELAQLIASARLLYGAFEEAARAELEERVRQRESARLAAEVENTKQAIAAFEDLHQSMTSAAGEFIKLEQALSAELGKLERAKKEVDARTRMPIDLVFLYNPAVEALFSKKVRDALADYQREHEIGRSAPWLISVSSAGDSATRTIFPMAMSLGGTFKKFRSPGGHPPYQEEDWLRTAPQSVYRVADFRSDPSWRFIDDLNDPDPRWVKMKVGVDERGYDRWDDVRVRLASDVITHVIDDKNPSAALKKWTPVRGGETDPTKLAAYRKAIRDALVANLNHGVGSAVVVNGDTYPFRAVGDGQSAYWFVRAPERLIPDHSDLFSPRSVALIAAMLRFTGALQP